MLHERLVTVRILEIPRTDVLNSSIGGLVLSHKR